MGSPVEVLTILAAYVIFVKKIGPHLMKDRKPFELKGLIIIYNIIQVLANAYIVYLSFPVLGVYTEFVGKSGRCFRLSETHPEAQNVFLLGCYIYCLLKVFDLLDTVFFVLRKRYNQVSFLHFYHHLIMCSTTFLIFQYMSSNNPVAVMGIINSGVHVLVYFYYLMSAIRPDLKKSISWKRYITVVQIIQFLFGIVWLLYPLSKGDGCGYSLVFSYFLLVQDIVLLLLFGQFYVKTYIMKKSKTK